MVLVVGRRGARSHVWVMVIRNLCALDLSNQRDGKFARLSAAGKHTDGWLYHGVCMPSGITSLFVVGKEAGPSKAG